MTREEILALEPGPELDRLVAERVMGWKAWRNSVPHHWAREEQGVLVPTGWTINGETNCGPVWSPSTDIVAALEALLHVMEAHGYDVMIESVSYVETATETNGIAWMVVLDPFDRARDQVKAESSHSLPLAICRAVLLAVMGVDNED